MLRRRQTGNEVHLIKELAKLLRSYGWRVSPPGKSKGDGPCPTCGQARTPNARDHALRLGAEGDVTAEQLIEVAGCTLQSAHNTLSTLAHQGLMRRVGRGRYRSC